MDIKDIKDFNLQELKEEMGKISAPSYRAKQVFDWLYKRGVNSFDKMKNLPQSFRDILAGKYYVSSPELYEQRRSMDGTEKFLFRLTDNKYIESVVIPAGKRKTLCISTQVGCKYGCVFCASGAGGFIRNLRVSEIINQILFMLYMRKYSITNYVFMGMGEPLDNYENLSKAILIMNDADALRIAARRITVSTCGIVAGIMQLKDIGLHVNLSLSVHSTDDSVRNKLMPVNMKYPLDEVIRACEAFLQDTGRMITLEYVLIKDMNDSAQEADELAKMSKRLHAKVNLIPYSPVPLCGFHSPSKHIIEEFMRMLMEQGVGVTLRDSKGKDIHAACGQLAGRITG